MIPQTIKPAAQPKVALILKRPFSSETIDTIAFEVDYMEGMEPFVGNALDGRPVWNFFENNISELFMQTKTMQVPKELSEMEEISAQNQNYSSDAILEIANDHRNSSLSDGNTLSLYIVFLDGYFTSDGEVNESVLGVSIGSTGVIAIFKPAITDNTFASSHIRSFTEQAVLIHEAGHALGLVNNGLPLQSDHHDEEHGAHCTNQDCVMYWANEGSKDLIEFIIENGFSNTTAIIFKDECLADAHAQLPSS